MRYPSRVSQPDTRPAQLYGVKMVSVNGASDSVRSKLTISRDGDGLDSGKGREEDDGLGE